MIIDGQSDLLRRAPAVDYVDVQIQDHSGVWVTVSNVIFDLQRVGLELRSIASRYPNRRVRAVDKSGRLIDLI